VQNKKKTEKKDKRERRNTFGGWGAFLKKIVVPTA